MFGMVGPQMSRTTSTATTTTSTITTTITIMTSIVVVTMAQMVVGQGVSRSRLLRVVGVARVQILLRSKK